MDNNEKDLVVMFPDKAELVFSSILKNYGLEETDEEFDKYISEDKESKEMILRDAVDTITKKIIPEKGVIELLQKHLGISQEDTEKIITDIKNKLLPLLLIYPEEKLNDPIFTEELSKKNFGAENNISEIKNETKELIERIKASKKPSLPTTKEKPTTPYLKKAPIIDVEKNAENMEKEGKNIVTKEKDGFIKKSFDQIQDTSEEDKTPQTQEIKPDTYREPIE